MDIQITPHALRGCLQAPPSKSDAHRILIAAALADKPTAVSCQTLSDDLQATLRCLQALGAKIAHAPGQITVTPITPPQSAPLLDCGESGTTLRFLLPVTAACYEAASFRGSGRLPQRPLSDLTDTMQAQGCTFSAQSLPFSLRGRLRPGHFFLPGNVSSQYISGLLFALPLLQGDSEIRLSSPLESAAYLEMTLATLRAFGISVQKTSAGFHVPGCQRYRSPGELQVEGDWSNAAFFLTAGVLGGPVALTGLSLTSLQGDRNILSLLRQGGGEISLQEERLQAKQSPLSAQEISVMEIPDLLPILAVAACAAQGRTLLKDAARLRLKESDRLQSTSAALRALGGNVKELPDALLIEGPTQLKGGVTSSFGDHRIAMAVAVASILCANQVVLQNAEAVEKSYPHFWADFTHLGGQYHVI